MLVGAGATGFHVAHQLVGLGAKRIEIWDMDTIAESNLNRQLYGISRIGKNKATALVEMIASIAPGGREQLISARPEELELYTLTLEDVEEFSIIINATDNLYHHGAMLRKLLLLRPAGDFIYISPRMAGFEAEVFVVNGREENVFAYYHTKEEWAAINATRQSCTDGGAQFNPSIITTSVVLAALTIQQIINILNGEESYQWVRLEIDTLKISEREPFTTRPTFSTTGDETLSYTGPMGPRPYANDFANQIFEGPEELR